MVDIKKIDDTDLSDKAVSSIIYNHLQSSQQIDTDLLDEADYHKSIFNLFNQLHHLKENETKTNKTALKYIYIYINRKLQLLDDDTDDIDFR